MAKKHKNILVTRFSALGDVAMTLPVVYDACRANPDSRFIFLTRSHPARIFINRPKNLIVIGIDTDAYKGPGGIRSLATKLRMEYDIDFVADLHDVLRTKLLRFFMRLHGIKSKHIDKNRAAKRALTRPNNKMLVQLKPTPERYRDVFRNSGIPLADSFKSVFGNGKGPEAEFAAVTPPKQTGEKWLAIAPFAKHAGKIYPIEQLQTVVDEYASRPGWKLFIFGFGEKESADIDRLSRGRENVVNMARTGLGMGGELSLLSHCDTMLSMDSANMHLASLVGLRAVTVWGATHPFAGFLGNNQNPDDICQIDLTCRPCSVFGNKPCLRGDYHCLHGIPPTLIIDKISRTVNK